MRDLCNSYTDGMLSVDFLTVGYRTVDTQLAEDHCYSAPSHNRYRGA